MEQEDKKTKIQSALTQLRQEFASAAARAHGNRGKWLRAWFTGENPVHDESLYGGYAARVAAVEQVFAAGDEGQFRQALKGLKGEFEAAAAVHSMLPPDGAAALAWVASSFGSAAPAILNPKASIFSDFARRVDDILKI